MSNNGLSFIAGMADCRLPIPVVMRMRRNPPPAATPHPPFTREVAMPLGIDGGIDALATKQSPGLFLPNANAFGASCLLHCVQFTHRTLQDYNLQKCRAGCPHPAACARFHQGLAFYLIPPAVRPRRIWTGTPRQRRGFGDKIKPTVRTDPRLRALR